MKPLPIMLAAGIAGLAVVGASTAMSGTGGDTPDNPVAATRSGARQALAGQRQGLASRVGVMRENSRGARGPRGVRGAQGLTGTAGTAGLTGAAGGLGATGPAGPTGAQGIGAIYKVDTGAISVVTGSYISGTLSCPAGTYVVGTGTVVMGLISGVTPYSSFAGVFLTNDLGFTVNVSAQIVCAAGTSWAQRSALTGGAVAWQGGADRAQALAADRGEWADKVGGLKQQAEAHGLTPTP